MVQARIQTVVHAMLTARSHALIERSMTQRYACPCLFAKVSKIHPWYRQESYSASFVFEFP
jgi:hypothetical protein